MNITGIQKKILCTCVAVYSFLGTMPFFLWETFEGGRYSNLFGIPIISLFGTLIIVFWIMNQIGGRSYIRIKKSDFLLGCGILIISVLCIPISGGIEHAFSGEWLIFITAALVIFLPDEDKLCAYKIYKWMFAVTLIIPIIYYVILHLGISIPYSTLQSYEAIKSNNGLMFYKVYPFNIQLSSKYGDVLTEFRLSGIYDEAGRLGTLAGMFLISERFKLKNNWQNILVFIGGCMTFSLSFFMFTFIYFIFYLIQKNDKKKLLIISIVIVALILFFNVEFSNPALNRLQERIAFTTEGFVGDNRTNNDYNAYFNTIFSKGIKEILFGQGFGSLGILTQSTLTDGSSYKALIFDYGFIGFFSQIFWLLFYTIATPKKVGSNYRIGYTMLLFSYIANIYQRPTMFNMSYLLIFVGGLMLLNYDQKHVKRGNK